MTSISFIFTFAIGLIIGLSVMWISTNGRITDYQEEISNLHSIILNKKKK